MSFDKKWNYKDAHRWSRDYPLAGGNQQSPIAIKTDNTNPCDLLCDIAFRFEAGTTCHARINNRTPLITFDSKAGHLKYLAQKQIVGLRAMTLHTPSMHTIDGTQYDLEVILYYKLSGPLNPDDPNYIPGGTAVSLLFQRGPDYGDQNTFLNAFIHQLPTHGGQTKDKTINVGKKWTPAVLFPESRSFFSYPGSLPFPPAEEEWNWIVMEEVQAVGGSIVDTLEVLFKGNRRSVQTLGSRVVNYNASVDISLVIAGASNTALIATNNATITAKTTPHSITDEKKRLTLLDKERERSKSWYTDRKILFQGIVLSIVLLLVIYAAYKAAKYIIFNDLVNKAIVKHVRPGSSTQNSSSESSPQPQSKPQPKPQPQPQPQPSTVNNSISASMTKPGNNNGASMTKPGNNNGASTSMAKSGNNKGVSIRAPPPPTSSVGK